MKNIDITPAELVDIPALCELLNELFAQEAEFKPDQEAQCRGLSAILAEPDLGRILVARQHGKVIGMVNLLFTVSTALGARVAILEDMVVAPAGRGSGIGSQLIKAALALAADCGCRRITLLTDSDNFHAQNFYAKHGFKPSAMMAMRLSLELAGRTEELR